jgi:hypothetical protein
MEGDLHATRGDRQISMLSAKAREWLLREKSDRMCFAAFKENITCSETNRVTEQVLQFLRLKPAGFQSDETALLSGNCSTTEGLNSSIIARIYNQQRNRLK